MTTATYQCKCCGQPFTARTADRARGWARFCSKSCKAKKQEQHTHASRDYHQMRSAMARGDGTCFPSPAEGDIQ